MYEIIQKIQEFIWAGIGILLCIGILAWMVTKGSKFVLRIGLCIALLIGISFSIQFVSQSVYFRWLWVQTAPPAPDTTVSIVLPPNSPRPTPYYTPPPPPPTPTPPTLQTYRVYTRPAESPRFEAVRVEKLKQGVKVRLYDARKETWLDDELHTLKQEPRVGTIIEVAEVRATYVGPQRN